MRPQIIITVLIAAFLRMLLVFFKGARKVTAFPKFRRFLGYLIGLAIGEIIYAISIQDESCIDILKTKYSELLDKHRSSSGETFKSFTIEDAPYHSYHTNDIYVKASNLTPPAFTNIKLAQFFAPNPSAATPPSSNQEKFTFRSTASKQNNKSEAANSNANKSPNNNIKKPSPSETEPSKTEKEDGSSPHNEVEPSADKSDSMPEIVEPPSSETQQPKREEEDGSSPNDEAEPSKDKIDAISVKVVAPPPNNLHALTESSPKKKSSIPKAYLPFAPPPPTLLLASTSSEKTKPTPEIDWALLDSLKLHFKLLQPLNIHQKTKPSNAPQPQLLLAQSPPMLLLPSTSNKKTKSTTEIGLALLTLSAPHSELPDTINVPQNTKPSNTPKPQLLLASSAPTLLLPSISDKKAAPSTELELALFTLRDFMQSLPKIDIALKFSEYTPAVLLLSYDKGRPKKSSATERVILNTTTIETTLNASNQRIQA